VSRIKNKYETIAKIGDIGAPTLIVHGLADDKVPPSHSRRLVEVAPELELLEIPHGNHINLFQRPEFVLRMLALIDSLSA